MYWLQKTLPLALLSLLIFQVSALSYEPQIPKLSFGNFVERTVSVKPTVLPELLQTEFIRESIERHDSAFFVGDVLLARNVEFLMRQHGSSYPYLGFDFTTYDVNPAIFGNFEASVLENHIPTQPRQLNFSVDSRFLPPLVSADFTHFSLANNHTYDFNSEGYQSTQSYLSEAGLKSFGHPNEINSDSITYIEINDVRVAVLALNVFFEGDPRSGVSEALRSAAEESDYQFVYIHWGEEYDLRHSSAQEDLARYFIKHGADAIIGHHPHVVQGIDLIEGVPVFYSLGNYIFDQYFSKDVQEGLVLQLKIEDGLIFNLLPVDSKLSLSQPTLMLPERHADFLRVLSRKSHPALREQIANGRIELIPEVASSPKLTMMNQ